MFTDGERWQSSAAEASPAAATPRLLVCHLPVSASCTVNTLFFPAQSDKAKVIDDNKSSVCCIFEALSQNHSATNDRLSALNHEDTLENMAGRRRFRNYATPI